MRCIEARRRLACKLTNEDDGRAAHAAINMIKYRVAHALPLIVY